MKMTLLVLLFLLFSGDSLKSQSAEEYYQKGLFLHSIGKSE